MSMLPARKNCVRAFFFLCHSPDDNAYAHPLDLLPLVDLNLRKVIRIDQHSTPPKVRHTAPAADNILAQTTKCVTPAADTSLPPLTVCWQTEELSLGVCKFAYAGLALGGTCC